MLTFPLESTVISVPDLTPPIAEPATGKVYLFAPVAIPRETLAKVENFTKLEYFLELLRS